VKKYIVINGWFKLHFLRISLSQLYVCFFTFVGGTPSFLSMRFLQLTDIISPQRRSIKATWHSEALRAEPMLAGAGALLTIPGGKPDASTGGSWRAISNCPRGTEVADSSWPSTWLRTLMAQGYLNAAAEGPFGTLISQGHRALKNHMALCEWGDNSYW